jgi:LemA protein
MGEVAPLFIAGGLAALVVLWGVLTFNALVRARNRVDESWSGVDVQLKRRRDLVPNLVQAVEAYARQEQETMSALTDARSAAAASTSRVFREQAESRLSGALAAVHVAAEAYPDLRASPGFTRLQAQLAEVEEDIVGARRIFNSNVQRYNDLVQAVPAAAIARLAGYRGRQYFDVYTSVERDVPNTATPSHGTVRSGGIAAA